VLQHGTGSSVVSFTPIAGILTDLAILRVSGTLRLYAGGSTGDVVVAPANLNTSSGAEQLKRRDVPLTN
jgi:type IV pilus assembly protein PilY1